MSNRTAWFYSLLNLEFFSRVVRDVAGDPVKDKEKEEKNAIFTDKAV